GREAALGVYLQRRIGVLDAGDGRERNLGAVAAADVEVLERVRTLQPLRRQLHDHPILIERVVDDADLFLTEGVRQRGVYGAHRQAELHGLVAVDDDGGLRGLVLLIGIYVGEFGQLGQCIA